MWCLWDSLPSVQLIHFQQNLRRWKGMTLLQVPHGLFGHFMELFCQKSAPFLRLTNRFLTEGGNCNHKKNREWKVFKKQNAKCNDIQNRGWQEQLTWKKEFLNDWNGINSNNNSVTMTFSQLIIKWLGMTSKKITYNGKIRVHEKEKTLNTTCISRPQHNHWKSLYSI
jgi:hypothetical protein